MKFTEQSLLFSIIKKVDVIKSSLQEELSDFGLNFNQALIAIALYTESKESLEPGDFIYALGLSKASVSQALTKLETLGLIKRSLNEEDARRTSVMLTSEGSIVATKSMGIIQRHDRSLESQISKEELKTLLSFLSNH